MLNHQRVSEARRFLHRAVCMVFPDPEIRDYETARRVFTKECKILVHAQQRMEVFVLSGEQSIIPSERTRKELHDCFAYLDELIVGGGPGIAIEKNRVESIKPTGTVTFHLEESGLSFSNNKETLDYFEVSKDDVETHPYIKMCEDFKSISEKNGERCHYLLEEFNHTDKKIILDRRHVVIVKTEEKMPDNTTRPCLPMAVIEDLHLPFRPRQAAVYRYLTPENKIYHKFMNLKTWFLKEAIHHDTQYPPPHRLIDDSGHYSV